MAWHLDLQKDAVPHEIYGASILYSCVQLLLYPCGIQETVSAASDACSQTRRVVYLFLNIA